MCERDLQTSSMSSLGVFADECSTFLDMINDTGIDKKQQRYIIMIIIIIIIIKMLKALEENITSFVVETRIGIAQTMKF